MKIEFDRLRRRASNHELALREAARKYTGGDLDRHEVLKLALMFCRSKDEAVSLRRDDRPSCESCPCCGRMRTGPEPFCPECGLSYGD